MQIGPRAPDLRAPSPSQNHFLHELFFTVLHPATPQTCHFVLARAARSALRSDQVASSRSLGTCAALTLAGVALAGCAALSACSRKHHAVAVPAAPQIRSGETGLASWYGHPYHGRPAADGEIYDMEKLTAAHRTLPFGTWVRVVNLTNDKTVDVRITDRGPFVENRIIDLSHAAAVAIALIGPGVARVRLDILSVPTPVSGENWYAVQAGAFLDPDRAERLRASLERDFGPAHLVQRAGSPPLWRVLVGRVPSEEAATALAQRVRSQTGTAFVVRLDVRLDPAARPAEATREAP
jgi:peptidoglycan lytic transglycosylase